MAILVDELREYPDVGAPVHVVVPHGHGRGVRGAARVRGAAGPAARVVPARPLRPAAARPGRRRRARGGGGADGRAAAAAWRGRAATARAAARSRRRAWPGCAEAPARPCCASRRASLVVIGGPPGRGQVDARGARGRPRAGAGARSGRHAGRARPGLGGGAGGLARGPRRRARRRLRARWRSTTALRHGHRLGLAKAAAAAGVPAHLVLLDADADACRAGRAAQGAPRISDGLFEHLLREWEAFRRTLGRGVRPARRSRSVDDPRPRGGGSPRRVAISPSRRRVRSTARAGEGNRTPGLRITRALLYQLSYSGRRARV